MTAGTRPLQAYEPAAAAVPGGAFFVVMLQLTLVNEGWPLRRLGRISSGPVALLVAWAIAITLYLLLVHTDPRPSSGLYPRTGPPLTGAQFGAVLTAIGLWQVIFYVAFRGWPFAALSKRAVRLAIANITAIAAGIATYLILHTAIALSPSIASAVAGCALTAVLFCGMLFEGLGQAAAHPSRERVVIVGAIVVVAAALFGALTAIAHQSSWTSASPSEWVTYAGLNAIGLGIISHVAIGRRWPFVREAGLTTR